jgi:two-component system, OmpR family, response regulator
MMTPVHPTDRRTVVRPRSLGAPVHPPTRPPRCDIKFLRWPHEEAERPQFLKNRIPVLWIVESNFEPPRCIDPLEDWVRPPLHQRDVDARVASLTQRARSEQVPVITADNVLHTREFRLPLADSEAVIMTALVENFQRVVPRKQLAECGWGNAAQEHRNALDLRILRLRRRLAPLKLEIVTVWGRGYMLERDDRSSRERSGSHGPE